MPDIMIQSFRDNGKVLYLIKGRGAVSTLQVYGMDMNNGSPRGIFRHKPKRSFSIYSTSDLITMLSSHIHVPIENAALKNQS